MILFLISLGTGTDRSLKLTIRIFHTWETIVDYFTQFDTVTKLRENRFSPLQNLELSLNADTLSVGFSGVF